MAGGGKDHPIPLPQIPKLVLSVGLPSWNPPSNTQVSLPWNLRHLKGVINSSEVSGGVAMSGHNPISPSLYPQNKLSPLQKGPLHLPRLGLHPRELANRARVDSELKTWEGGRAGCGERKKPTQVGHTPPMPAERPEREVLNGETVTEPQEVATNREGTGRLHPALPEPRPCPTRRPSRT